MKRVLSALVFALIFSALVFCLSEEGAASSAVNDKAVLNDGHGLILSDMLVKITSMGHTATFQLYDTLAAREFYDQLPLKLDLTNFRDAQWMFYPPEKLNVSARETYHDGKKGELSYYAPSPLMPAMAFQFTLEYRIFISTGTFFDASPMVSMLRTKARLRVASIRNWSLFNPCFLSIRYSVSSSM